MCKAFSCLVTKAGKVCSQIGLDSHDQIHREFKGGDHELQDTREVEPTFARVEVIPTNSNYLKPDGWTVKIDESITPSWWSKKHENAAYRAKDKWHKTILSRINMEDVLNPIHSFKIKSPEKITEKHLKLLREWASVVDSVWASVRASVYAYIGSLFPNIVEWRGADPNKTPFNKIKGYPYQSAVKLWKLGLVPSYDGVKWRLHGGLKGAVLWEGKI